MSHKPGPKPKNELPIRIESVIVRLSNGTTLEGDDFGILIMERGFPAKRCSYEQFIDGMKAIEKQREQNDKTTLIKEQSNG